MKGRFLISWRLLFGLVSLPAAVAAQERALIAADTVQVTGDSVAADTVQQELVRASEVAARLTAIGDTLQTLLTLWQGASDEERELLRMQGVRYIDEVGDLEGELLHLLPQLDSTDVAVDSIARSFRAFLIFMITLYEQAIDSYAARLNVLRERRLTTAPENLGDLESDIREARVRLDTVLVRHMGSLVAAESAGIDVGDAWGDLDRFLITRAESQVGRLQIADSERDRLRAEVRDAGRVGRSEAEIAALRTRLQIADQRIEGIVASVRTSARLLDRRGIETAQYRQIIIAATGEVTSDILNIRVLLGVLRGFVQRVWSWIEQHSPTLLVRLFIIIGFIILFRVAFRMGWESFQRIGRVKLPRLLTDLIGRFVGPTATILGLVTALWLIGVNLTTLVAGVGVAGIIIGLALQDSMSNLAAGLFILIYRPYDVEDVVSAGGVVGKVKAMGLANTSIVTFDNRVLFVPNRKIWSEVIENRSAAEVRRVDTVVKVSYREDLERIFGILRGVLQEDEAVLETPAPSVFVSELGDPWIEVEVWAWVATANWWTVTTQLPRAIRLRFQAEGVEAPVPWKVWPGRTEGDSVVEGRREPEEPGPGA